MSDCQEYVHAALFSCLPCLISPAKCKGVLFFHNLQTRPAASIQTTRIHSCLLHMPISCMHACSLILLHTHTHIQGISKRINLLPCDFKLRPIYFFLSCPLISTATLLYSAVLSLGTREHGAVSHGPAGSLRASYMDARSFASSSFSRGRELRAGVP